MSREAKKLLSKSKKANIVIDSLTDDQLFELANKYITTDESLDQFKFKNNKSSKDLTKSLQNSNYNNKQSRDNYVNNNIGNDNLEKFPSFNSENIKKSIIPKGFGNNNKIPPNIQKALEYYNMVK